MRFSGKSILFKIFIALAILIFVFSFFTLYSSANKEDNIPSHTSEFYVNDFANVFSSEKNNELVSKAKTFAEEQTDGVQIVITTVNNLNRYSNRRLCCKNV